MPQPTLSKRQRVIRRRILRRLVSAWLALHLAAVIIAPAAVPPASPLFESAWLATQPYLGALYLNHGYHFFAPEPSFSTLVDYRAELPDGTLLDERMPNRGIWPRLLYHRHFMLTEYLTFFDADVQVQLCESYQAHLRQKYHVEEVSVTKIEHLLPSEYHILEGGTLQHPELWVAISLDELRDQAAREAAEREAEDAGP